MKNAEFALKKVMNIIAEQMETCDRMSSVFPDSECSYRNRYLALEKVWNEIIKKEIEIKFGEPF